MKHPNPSKKSCRLSVQKISKEEWNNDYEWSIWKRAYNIGIRDFIKINNLKEQK